MERLVVHWIGAPPKGPVERVLQQLGVTLSGSKAGDPTVRIVLTPDSRALPTPLADGLPWIWLVGAAPSETAVHDAALAGAYDVLRSDEAGAASLLSRLRELAAPLVPPRAIPGWVVGNEASRQVLTQIARAARTSMAVLISGETGTGKEQTARLLHEWSPRRTKRFVPINCAAIPNELMEGELFGYARGAFSGAVKSYEGALAAAAGGTVFLDEIDDTPSSTQVKLLRVLEDHVVTRLGENASHKVDFRIVAASNRDLRRLIEEGKFGEDLYERLAIVSIRLPPLRDRLEDLPALTQHFVERFYAEEPDARELGHVTAVSAPALRALAEYPWPGNIRELRNAVFESLVYKRAGRELLLADLPLRILRKARATDDPSAMASDAAVARRLSTRSFNLKKEIETLERAALTEALRISGGNATDAARLLGEVGRGASSDPGGTVRAMMRRLGVRAGRERGTRRRGET